MSVAESFHPGASRDATPWRNAFIIGEGRLMAPASTCSSVRAPSLCTKCRERVQPWLQAKNSIPVCSARQSRYFRKHSGDVQG